MAKQILFIIDRSGSMDSGKLDSAKKGIEDILTDASGKKSTVRMDDHAGLISFDDSIDRDVGISPLSATKDDIIEALGRLSPRSNTALFDAIGAGVDDLAMNSDIDPWIICLTDGEENASNRFRKDTEVIEYAKKKGINLRIIIIGIGDNVDQAALLKITSSFGGQYVHSTSSPNSVRTSILQAARSVAKGGAGKSTLPERVEIDIEHGKVGDVEPEELERHSIPYGGGKTKGNGGHKHHPVHRKTPQPDLCGDISEDLRERMHKVVNTSKHLMEMDRNMIWKLSVPVEYIEKEIFLDLWPGRSSGRFCEYFSNIAGLLMELGEDDRLENPCFRRGKPFIHFLSDVEFGRNEKRYVDKGVTSPGIYVREDYRSGSLNDERVANLWFGMAFSTIKAMDYYLNCRSRAVKNSSDLHSFMNSVMALYSLSREELDYVIDNADIVGPWAIPLYIVRKMSMIPPNMVLEYLMTILPIAELRRRQSSYDTAMGAMMDDLSLVAGSLLICKHRLGRPQDMWRVLERFISHRRAAYGAFPVELVEIPVNELFSPTCKAPSGYEVDPIGILDDRNRGSVFVFEVIKHGEPFRTYCVRCAVDSRSPFAGVHCTCKDFKYNSGPAGRPCKHILLVLKESFVWKSNGDVATRINDAFSTSETYV